jgi:hypothetical protein
MRRLLIAPLVAGLAVAAFGAGGAGAMTGSCSSGKVVKTPGYVFALSIGPMETMYTPAQVKAKHPTGGEVMLAGKMVGGMAGMDMGGGGSRRHLEVHICTTAGTVVKGAHPAIMLNGAMVPVAVMEGVGEGASDLHYGNNVNLTTGQKVTVVVTLKGRKAVFHTTVSKSSSM